MSKYVIKSTSNGQFHWNLKAGNGEIILTSETYVTKQGCENGIESSKNNIADSNFQKLTATNGQYYFNQRSNNYQVIGTSEMYTTASARDNGIASVQRNAPNAIIEDLS